MRYCQGYPHCLECLECWLGREHSGSVPFLPPYWHPQSTPVQPAYTLVTQCLRVNILPSTETHSTCTCTYTYVYQSRHSNGFCLPKQSIEICWLIGTVRMSHLLWFWSCMYIVLLRRAQKWKVIHQNLDSRLLWWRARPGHTTKIRPRKYAFKAWKRKFNSTKFPRYTVIKTTYIHLTVSLDVGGKLACHVQSISSAFLHTETKLTQTHNYNNTVHTLLLLL